MTMDQYPGSVLSSVICNPQMYPGFEFKITFKKSIKNKKNTQPILKIKEIIKIKLITELKNYANHN